MHDKRYQVKAANSWFKSRKLGVYVDVVQIRARDSQSSNNLR